MESKPGTYALLLRSETTAHTQIGGWGWLRIRPGHYIYVGSAFGPGGVRARVLRHCRGGKSKHWHIDYLRAFVTPESVWYSHFSIPLEHRWAEALAKSSQTEPVKGFGCSDCRCASHLFFSVEAPTSATFTHIVGNPVGQWSCDAD